ncbi:MAG: magnesium transporter, partial [Candidatus Eisenbacteria bacterium]|nr:magnesium transporter [Candidatus Eisenbacteria bacterium]
MSRPAILPRRSFTSVLSSGGNSGSQASTLVIRAMALGEVRLADWWRVIRRELMTGLLM